MNYEPQSLFVLLPGSLEFQHHCPLQGHGCHGNSKPKPDWQTMELLALLALEV